ncbi:MAG: universal stress protein [Oceanicaulis sp.]|uniref:universal stress protein n=1 Tax=Glycocaulis sp. TaxID=1969725 RepID=UPI0025BF6E05|nr:universal stress protein [Glycocaulis sp.]MCC5980674.1 universal stress protein [Oceanicaulis sp.]MCH8521901.1 universal stress protein [Glycocaulis sp.]
MAPKTLMVHVSPDGFKNGRVDAALALAKAFGARLIGVGAMARPEAIVTPEGVMHPDPDNVAMLEKDLKALSLRFSKKAAALGKDKASWRSALTAPAPYLAENARAADMLIVSSRADSDFPVIGVDPSDVIMAAGRPVLAVPRGKGDMDFSTVLVAWKDTPQARRAVAAALPVLASAKRVVVTGVGDETAGEALEEVAVWLASHGVKAETVHVKEKNAGKAIIKAAELQGAGLIVAGAYGRSRLREFILGGVTRDLLFKSKIPCLFSH